MKFISFIASTMLIVLISQHSLGLPITSTIAGELCSEGFEIINGKCMPIQSSTIGIKTGTFSNPPETVTKFLPEESTVTVPDSTTTEFTVELTTSKDFPENVTIDLQPPVTQLIQRKSGECPKGMEHGNHGICEPIQLFSTTEVTAELTTDLNDNVGTGGVDNVQGCPKGTEPDEQGACQEIQGSSTKKMITDPKLLLNKDGSCPENYKMIDGRCLYIKPTKESAPYSQGLIVNGNVAGNLQPKTGVDEESKDEVVPVLPNNLCPEGTIHSENGLCKKFIRPASASILLKPDGSCPDDYELIKGECTFQHSKILAQSGLSVTTIPMPLSATFVEVPINTDNLFLSTTLAP